MANLYITYFEKISKDKQNNPLPIGELSHKLQGERVSFTTSTVSGLVPKSAKFVRIIADADAYINWGDSSEADPVATATSALKLEANREEYFGLDEQSVRGGAMKFAVYDGSS